MQYGLSKLPVNCLRIEIWYSLQICSCGEYYILDISHQMRVSLTDIMLYTVINCIVKTSVFLYN